VSVRGRLQQNMVDAGPRTIDRIPWNPDLLRDQVGSRESDPVDIRRQCVRVFANFCNCLIALSLKSPHGSAGADAVTVQEEHDFAYLLCFAPRLRNPLPALRADPVHRLQFGFGSQ